jgi:hypothetical protein
MSNFIKRTLNPKTQKFEDAIWMDDYCGQHKYSVYFPSDKTTYPELGRNWEFEDDTPEEDLF